MMNRIGFKGYEQTYIMVKPEGVQRERIGSIIGRFEKKGLQLEGIKLVIPDKNISEKHYDVHKGKPHYDDITTNLQSGPVVAMVWGGENAVQVGRDLIGKPNIPGTIRGDFAHTNKRNLVHGSDSVENAKEEIKNWFKPEEIHSWKRDNPNRFIEVV